MCIAERYEEVLAAPHASPYSPDDLAACRMPRDATPYAITASLRFITVFSAPLCEDAALTPLSLARRAATPTLPVTHRSAAAF